MSAQLSRILIALCGIFGTVLLGSRLLPWVFGYLAFGLGIAFEVVGLIALFTSMMDVVSEKNRRSDRQNDGVSRVLIWIGRPGTFPDSFYY